MFFTLRSEALRRECKLNPITTNFLVRKRQSKCGCITTADTIQSLRIVPHRKIGANFTSSMNTPSASTMTLVALLPLLAWRVYSRFRRMVGRQRLSKIRPWVTLVIFPLLISLLSFAAFSHVERLWWLAGGLGIGSLLGIYGLRKTRFEPTKQGLFYTPNAHLGIALSLLFVGRIIYRLVEVYAVTPDMPHGMDDFARSSLTLSVFGLLAGYYIAYAIGLVRWRFSVLRAKRLRESQNKTTEPQ